MQEPGDGAVGTEQRATFVVRLWRERRPSAPWRSQVEHVESGDRQGAQGLADTIRLIRGWLRKERSG